MFKSWAELYEEAEQRYQRYLDMMHRNYPEAAREKNLPLAVAA